MQFACSKIGIPNAKMFQASNAPSSSTTSTSKARDWHHELSVHVPPDFTIECLANPPSLTDTCFTDDPLLALVLLPPQTNQTTTTNATFRIHSFILKQYPPVLSAIPDAPFNENRNRVLFISDFRANVVEAFITFLYNREWRAATFQPLARDLLLLADRYMIDELKEHCALSLLPSFQALLDKKQQQTAAEKPDDTTATASTLLEFVELAVKHHTPLLQVACELIGPHYTFSLSTDQLMYVISLRGDLNKLKQSCEQQLIRRLCNDNACSLFFFAVQHACTDLVDRAYEHIKLNWNFLKQTKPEDIERLRECVVVKHLLAPVSPTTRAARSTIVSAISDGAVQQESTASGRSSSPILKSCDWFRRSFMLSNVFSSLSKDAVSRFAALYPKVDFSTVPLPLNWSTFGEHFTVQTGKMFPVLRYNGPGLECSDSALAHTDHSIPQACGIYYFEITIANEGSNKIIGMGVCDGSGALNRMPGWDPYSVGYHGDDGKLFVSRLFGLDFDSCTLWNTGDTIGCGVDFANRVLFFTRNGMLMPLVRGSFPNDETAKSLYPAVGCRSPGAAVVCNLGQEPFVFDMMEYRRSI